MTTIMARACAPRDPGSPADRDRTARAEAELGLEAAVLEALLDRGEEAGGVGTVDEPVVVGQRQVDHRADRDRRREPVSSVTTTARLTTAPVPRIADLRLVDDRGVEQRAAAAGVGQREGAAGQLVRADLVGAGALGQVGDLAGEAGDVEVAGVRITGTSRPRSVSTAMPRCSASW